MAENVVPPTTGNVTTRKGTPAPDNQELVQVRFLQPTNHPDYGGIDADEVLEVTPEYAAHYRELGFAITDHKATVTRPLGHTKDPIVPPDAHPAPMPPE